MLQRVMIAGALATDPDFLIADEPTTALDVTIQAEIMAILDELRRERHLAVLFITHDLELASMICDRILVMYAGIVLEARRTGRPLRPPAPPVHGRPAQGPPVAGGAPRTPPGHSRRPPLLGEMPEGCPFAPRCAFVEDACRVAPPVLRELGGRGLHGLPEERGARRPPGGRWDGPGMTESATEVLRVADLSKTFRGQYGVRRTRWTNQAVREASFSVDRGRSLALVGESGSGKTTIARMIVGLETPTSGRIVLEGRELAARPRRDERRWRASAVQIVFQDPYTSLTPHQTVRAALDEAQRVHFRRSAAERRHAHRRPAGGRRARRARGRRPCRASCRAASASARRSPGRSPSSRTSSSSTSPSPRSTCRSRRRS